MNKKKIALILIGGICSGKTTLIRTLQKSYDFDIVSKDIAIYKSDMLLRKGIISSWESIRLNMINDIKTDIVVFDETIRVGKLKEIKERGYTAIAINLNTPLKQRHQRLQNRILIRDCKMNHLSKMMNIDFLSMSQDRRRKEYWTNKKFYDTIDDRLKPEFDTVLKELYLLGSDKMKPEEPNPICFNEIDYIYDVDSISDISHITLAEIQNNMKPYDLVLRMNRTRIKYCIWDVGGVLYNYSLDNLVNWSIRKGKDKNITSSNFKEILNLYMSGKIDYMKFCDSICDANAITKTSYIYDEIEQCLRNGIGEVNSISKKLLESVKSSGIINCVLSNALPILVDINFMQEYINPKYRFYSFDIGALKPDCEAYLYVKKALNAAFDEMIFIDDKEVNVNAAKDLGIYSILFNKETIQEKLSKVINI